jgi:hypothetical protein
MVPLGSASIAFLSLGNATLQLASVPEMRGRVMALWAVAFLGSTPVGAPLIGWISGLDPRWGLGLGGVATMLCGLLAYRPLARAGVASAGASPVIPDLVVPGGPA